MSSFMEVVTLPQTIMGYVFRYSGKHQIGFACHVSGDRALLPREGRQACHAETSGAVGWLRGDVSEDR